MTYITLQKSPKPFQLTWEDVMFDRIPANGLLGDTDKGATITRKVEFIPQEIMDKVNIDKMIFELERFNEFYKDLFEKNLEECYTHFKLPKASGGWRKIDAPLEPLKTAQTMLANILQNVCGGLHHTAAFAYVENRSTVDAVKKHQRNESNWFLHTDFSGFFPNTTKEFVIKMFEMIFPFSEILKDERGRETLTKALTLAFYNGGLVQGSPLSPALTNMMFIPIDHALNTLLCHRKLVYTRYADDIYISGQECFPWKEIVKEIEKTLRKFNAVYQIKPEKTHFGSRKGRNWMLGLMLNAQNDITVGYKNKKAFKSDLTNFILDTRKGHLWDLEEVMHLNGVLSYYKMVEKDYFDTIIQRMNNKWHVNAEQMLRDCMSVAVA